MKRRRILALLAVSGAGLAGYLNSPVAISDDEAKERAFNAAAENVNENIEIGDCETDGVDNLVPYTELTSIADRTEEGLYVEVISSVPRPPNSTTVDGLMIVLPN